MTTKLEAKRNLSELLDKLVAAQKADIRTYSSGHLNESKLFKPPDSPSPRRSTWGTRHLSGPRQLQRSLTPDHSDLTKMQSALTSFTLGLLGGEVTTFPKPKQAGQTPLRGNVGMNDYIPAALSKASPRRSFSVLHEERERLLPRHLESITKTEEFLKLRAYEKDIIEKEQMLQSHFGSGKEAIQCLENKLDMDLEQLDHQGFGPGFHQLEAHSDAFDQLINGSQTFGHILQTIKSAYDNYLSHLLGGHVTKHRVLQEQLGWLTDMHTANAATIRQEAQNLVELEQRAKHVLEANRKLRAELKREKELTSQPQSESLKPTASRPEHVEPSERIEKLNRAICNVLDLTKLLRETIRKECVPTTVCTYLRHCIKETDVDIQRLTSQKEYYDHSISELTADLQEAIETADTREADAKKIWKKLESQTRRVESFPGSGLWGSAVAGFDKNKEQETDEEDDSDKWNWYIS